MIITDKWLAKHRTGYFAANPAEVVSLIRELDEARALLIEEQESRAAWAKRALSAELSQPALVDDGHAAQTAAWILARCLEHGDTIAGVLWLTLQLRNIDRGAVVK